MREHLIFPETKMHGPKQTGLRRNATDVPLRYTPIKAASKQMSCSLYRKIGSVTTSQSANDR